MNYVAARLNMVENQLRTNRITDAAVIGAVGAVPREAFVPKQLRGVAYRDGDIDLGGGRYMMQPLAFAGLLQAAEIAAGDVVLDIGCASGYAAAVLARLASTVVAIENDNEWVVRAGTLLASLSVDNVAVIHGRLTDGDPAHGPYQVVMIEGAVEHIPQALLDQLADGGRLVAVVARAPGIGHATVVKRIGQGFSSRIVFDAAVHGLPEFCSAPGFVL